jgi:hypothetical protein
MMNKKRSLLVALLVAICVASAAGFVAARAHAASALSTDDKVALYKYCRTSGKDPKFCCETVGGAYTTWVDSDGTIHTQCVFANSPGGNASNLAAAAPPFQNSLIGPATSGTQSGGQSNAGADGLVEITETFNNVIP